MAEFKFIPIKDISPDPNQPRKFFEERSMMELQASIKTNGVLQPIMVRPLGKKYMLVCGERRFKASTAEGLKEIPAVIRHLADDEALEVQITENLQRKDVHPMEEGIAFAALAKKYTTEEISLRVGKSQAFVVKRIKLAELVSDAQELFFSNRIEMKHAMLLCRISAEDQKAILKEVLPKNWKTSKDELRLWNLERMCEDVTKRLDSAPFKTSDAKLYSEAGACTKCAFNTANQPLLFEDLKGRHCTKPSCYNIKAERHEKNKLAELASNPDLVAVAGYCYDKADKDYVSRAKEMGIKVLDRDLYDEVDDDIEPMTFEAYVEDNFMDVDEMDEDEKQEAKEEYERHVQECADNKKHIEEGKRNGTIIEAFKLVGSDKGTNVFIELKEAGKSVVDAATGNAGDNEILREIAGIELREMRNKELDAEKVHAAVQLVLENSTEFLAEKPKRGWRLSQHEVAAAAVALFDAGSYGFRERIIKQYKLSDKYNLQPSDVEIFQTFNEFTINDMLRHFILDKLIGQVASRLKSGKALALHNVAAELHDMEVNTILLEHQEKAIKRGERTAARIKALRKKLAPAEA